MYELTPEPYHCFKCGHVGKAICDLITESHGEKTFEPECEECGSHDMEICCD